MMHAGPRMRGLMALSLLASTGCSTIREIPRDAYDAAPERRHVVVETRDGKRQEFEFARIAGDTLTGYIEHDNESGLTELRTVPIALDDVEHLSAKRLDWYRTALVSGAALGVVIIAALSRHKAASDTMSHGPPPPCEPCPP